jgi:hypothetical protein
MSEHTHDESVHHHHSHGRWEVTVTLTADHPYGAGQVLKQIARLVREGEVAADGINAKYGVEWNVTADIEGDPNALPHGDFKDGQGNIVHVDEDGFVVFIIRPESEEPDMMLDKRIKLYDWATEHGGITPFDMEAGE